MRGSKNPLRLSNVVPSASRRDGSFLKVGEQEPLSRVRFGILILPKSPIHPCGRGALFLLQSRKFLALGDDGNDQKQ